MNVYTRLGPRLDSIFNLISKIQTDRYYSSIWDCCCDHGYLGINILKAKLCERLIFIDQIPHIIDQLTEKIAPYDTGKHELIIGDAAELVLDGDVNNLVILAGVGGESIIEVMQGINKNNVNARVDYILCPSSKQKDLREYLINNKFGLLDELLVHERKRYYEVLFVKRHSLSGELSEVTQVCELWDAENEDHQRFLKKINQRKKSRRK